VKGVLIVAAAKALVESDGFRCPLERFLAKAIINREAFFFQYFNKRPLAALWQVALWHVQYFYL
jgi:hypothetical protein